jgi:predicted MFS family arabinose efflux permease
MEGTRVSRGTTWLMASACGVAVANIYFNQPLLGAMQRGLGVKSGIGAIPTATQLGYAVGLLFLVPLGDRVDRRALFAWLAAASAVTCLAVALAPTLPLLTLASLALGMTSVIAPGMTAYAATLAPPAQRGEIVGSVMTGLLMGVLLSRTVGGVLGEWVGWRAVFGIAAVAMVLLAVVILRFLPAQRIASPLGYAGLLRSLFTLFLEEKGLRLSALLGLTGFGAFSVFWATLALYLEDSPLHGTPAIAGAFGVVGAAGALVAPRVGRMADRGGARRVQLLAFGLGLAGFAAFALWPLSYVGLGVGVLLLDVGVQASHVTNLSRIYALRPDARSRLNTVYMFGYFLGGALGSAAGVAALARFGWWGVCAAGSLALALGLVGQLLAPGAGEIGQSRVASRVDREPTA